MTAPVRIQACFFNNKGWRRMSQLNVNRGDYKVVAVDPTFVGECERWWNDQLPAFSKIFSLARGYATYAPRSAPGHGGTIAAHEFPEWQRLASFKVRIHGVVVGVSGRRTCTVLRLRHRKTGRRVSILVFHTTPSAWSPRFKDGSVRKKAAQKAWKAGMEKVQNLARAEINQHHAENVILMGDANAKADKVREAWGNTMAKRPLHLYTSPSGYKIDHIAVVGRFRQTRDPWVIKGTPSNHDPFLIEGDLR